MAFINAVGQVLECPAAKPTPKQGQYGDQTMVEFSELKDHKACGDCKAAIDFWKFIEDSWRQM